MLLKTTNPRTIFSAAMTCLALFGALGIPSVSSRFTEGLFDGMRGALLGATVALIYLTFRLKRQQETGARRQR
jgi:hypothetical protein